MSGLPRYFWFCLNLEVLKQDHGSALFQGSAALKYMSILQASSWSEEASLVQRSLLFIVKWQLKRHLLQKRCINCEHRTA